MTPRFSSTLMASDWSVTLGDRASIRLHCRIQVHEEPNLQGSKCLLHPASFAINHKVMEVRRKMKPVLVSVAPVIYCPLLSCQETDAVEAASCSRQRIRGVEVQVQVIGGASRVLCRTDDDAAPPSRTKRNHATLTARTLTSSHRFDSIMITELGAHGQRRRVMPMA